jgi:RNA polymerase sigma-70 factor (ECF subfamily)
VTKEDLKKSEDIGNEKLLILASQADPKAFEPLYEKYFKRIFLFIHHRINDKAITADITSQTFLKALLNLHTFKFKGLPFSAWLFRIAINECNEFYRKNSRTRLVTIDEHAMNNLYDGLVADSRFDSLEQRLPEILQKLSIEELHLIDLRFFEQRSFKEVGQIMGITETFAKVKLYRTLEKMRNFFLKYYEEKN